MCYSPSCNVCYSPHCNVGYSPQCNVCYSPAVMCYSPHCNVLQSCFNVCYSPHWNVCYSPYCNVCYSLHWNVCYSPYCNVCYSPHCNVCCSPSMIKWHWSQMSLQKQYYQQTQARIVIQSTLWCFCCYFYPFPLAERHGSSDGLFLLLVHTSNFPDNSRQSSGAFLSIVLSTLVLRTVHRLQAIQ